MLCRKNANRAAFESVSFAMECQIKTTTVVRPTNVGPFSVENWGSFQQRTIKRRTIFGDGPKFCDTLSPNKLWGPFFYCCEQKDTGECDFSWGGTIPCSVELVVTEF